MKADNQPEQLSGIRLILKERFAARTIHTVSLPLCRLRLCILLEIHHTVAFWGPVRSPDYDGTRIYNNYTFSTCD
jgi:hypothetical protein